MSNTNNNNNSPDMSMARSAMVDDAKVVSDYELPRVAVDTESCVMYLGPRKTSWEHGNNWYTIAHDSILSCSG